MARKPHPSQQNIHPDTSDRRTAASASPNSSGEQCYELLGAALEADDAEFVGRANPEALRHYRYFQEDLIFNDLEFSDRTRRTGKQLFLSGEFRDATVTIGYPYRYIGPSNAHQELLGTISWCGEENHLLFRTQILFNQDSVCDTDCSCSVCSSRRWHYYQDRQNTGCKYLAGLMYALHEFLQHNPLGDATDSCADRFLNLYERKQQNRVRTDVATAQEPLRLVPRLIKKDYQLTVSFKVGAKKLFVIKQLDEFCQQVRNGETVRYGSSTDMSHRPEDFDADSQRWLRFIQRIVQEETEFCQRLDDAIQKSYYSRFSAKVGGTLNLFGWRLDEFYREMGEDAIDYEDRDEKTRKRPIRRKEADPRFNLYISPFPTADPTTVRTSHSHQMCAPEFQGILVEGQLPKLFFGMERAYYIEENHLCRSTPEFQEAIQPLSSVADQEGEFFFQAGRHHLPTFYYQALPQLQKFVDIIETNPDLIHAHLLPPASFVFYLDADQNDVQCRADVRYDNVRFSLLDHLYPERADVMDQYRNISQEHEVLVRLMQWFPAPDAERDELTCGGNEDLIYRFMAEGVDELISLGEVRCTNRFRAKNRINPVKVSVGVSVSEGLLDLEISTDNISPEELLEMLKHYRAKKNYFRLKDGSYASLDEQSLGLLAELMDSMHLSPREFVRGKMHLPLYRTLYLNKMLEEKEEVYSDRDSHFREMVKGFKTVNDADFDVPQNLTKIMRKYQKDGYKWLRTLETWQFGGILADDMGLGKTLQIIALLLAAKDRVVTSLVVTPASLVYNWGEELARFAPQLQVLIVGGTQAERRQKISSCMDYDVVITSYDLLKRDIHLYEDHTFEYEVIDEAQYIKTHTTAAAKAVKVIRSRYRFALTGTPIENRLSELWSIFDYLMPGFLYEYETFKRELETPIAKHQEETAIARLQKMTAPFILRRLKEDVLKDLPDKLEEVRYVRFASTQQHLYDGQVVHMKEALAKQSDEEFSRNKLAIFAELMRLRQICCDPSLCFENYQGESAKADACIDLIESAIDGGHRILLFSQFTTMLEIIQKKLDAERIPYYTITGATPKKKRLELVKEFNQGSTPIFLISLKAGGVGLNLTGADMVIHYDPWWNVAAQNQATDRAHRIGQTRKVTVYKLIAKNSIEEKILALQEAKRNLADQIISGDTGQLAGMSKEDLLALLD